MSAKEILLAEDEGAIREGLVTLFESEGYGVRAAADGESALRLFRARYPDLVLLDVMMPKMNGYAVCQEIRGLNRDVPVLFLTARDSDAEELRGLLLGADDYISKTASMPVLLARVAAVLARAQRAADPMIGDFDFLGCCVDSSRQCLRRPDGSTVELALREVEMLRYFVQHPNEVLSRDFLFTRFWGRNFVGEDATLSVAISRLREKLGPLSSHIETIYGDGYRFVGQ